MKILLSSLNMYNSRLSNYNNTNKNRIYSTNSFEKTLRNNNILFGNRIDSSIQFDYRIEEEYDSHNNCIRVTYFNTHMLSPDTKCKEYHYHPKTKHLIMELHYNDGDKTPNKVIKYDPNNGNKTESVVYNPESNDFRYQKFNSANGATIYDSSAN